MPKYGAMDTESSAIRMEIPSAVELVNVVRMTVMNAVESQGALTGSRLDDLRLATSEAKREECSARGSAVKPMRLLTITNGTMR